MVTSWSLHGPPRHPHDMRQWRFIRAQLANKREHMHRHRILALVGHFLGSRFSIWASGFLILLCFKWWRPVRTTNLLVGPCSALALVFYLIPSDIATIAMSLILPAKWVVHFFGFYPLGPIFLVKSCVMWPRTVLYHETCEDLFRWLILLRAQMYITAGLPAVKLVSFCVSAGQHLMKCFYY